MKLSFCRQAEKKTTPSKLQNPPGQENHKTHNLDERKSTLLAHPQETESIHTLITPEKEPQVAQIQLHK